MGKYKFKRLVANVPEEILKRFKIESVLQNITVTRYITRLIYKELKSLESIREEKNKKGEKNDN